MLAACAPAAGPLLGTPVPNRLPPTALPSGHRRLVFQWAYHEKVFGGKGEGVARMASPDSVRLDFFLENGAAGGFVILIGDSLFVPTGDEARRFIPPVAMLWAAFGRLTVQAGDTTARLDGDSLRAEIGAKPVWRVVFGPHGLARLQRIEKNRIEESVERPDSLNVLYRHVGAHRSLRLVVTREIEEAAFDEAIWRP